MSDATAILGLARAAHLLAPGEGAEALAPPHRALIEAVAALKPAADVTEGLLREDLLRARLAVWLGLVEPGAATRALREQAARLSEGSTARVADILVQHGQLTLPQVARVEQCLSALPVACLRCRGAIDRFLGAMSPSYACPACGAIVPSPLAGAQPGSSATVLPATATPTPGSKDDPTVQYGRNVLLPMPGRNFGRYRIVAELGRGGMGIVYQAFQLEIDRVVALKTLLAGPNAPEATVKRFLREAASCAHLSHPNIVTIHDVGTEGGIHYFTMQYVEGKTLSQVLKERKRLPLAEACRLVTDVARAVHYAHGKGIIHRDLKPSNILIDDAGHPHVMDFGLAKQVEGPTDLTLSGTTIGTPAYMSPEQAGGGKGEVDARTDVYSLGAILFECLAGQKVFTGDTDVQVIFKVVFEPPRPLCEVAPDIPAEVGSVVMRALEKDRERRYASAWEFSSALDAFRPRTAIEALPEGTTVVRRRGAPWAAVAAVVVLLAGGAAWKWWPRAESPTPPTRDSAKARSLLDRAALRSHADAVGLLTEAIACDPGLAEAFYARARAYQAIGKVEEALADYGKAIELNDSYLQARLYRALLVDRALMKPEEAKKDYDKILELDPGSEVGHLVTGISLYQQGKRAKALPYLEKAVSLNARDESALYYLIWCYLHTGEHLKAEEVSTKANTQFPASEVYLNLRGLSFYYRERWKEAQRDYEASLGLNGRNADTWNNLGLMWQARGDVEKAHECYTKALGISPHGVLYLKNRAELLMREERPEEALPDIAKALRLAPADFEAHLIAGQVQMGLSKSKEAIQEFNEAIRLNPRSGAAYWNLATAYAVKMDMASVMFAIKNLEKGMLVDPRDSRTRTMFEFSQWLKGSGFQLLLTPTDGGTPRQKAVAKLRAELPKMIDRLSRSRLPAQAVQYVDAVIGMDPEFPDAYLIRGICWSLAHEYDKAVPDLEKAVALNGKLQPARGMLASVAWMQWDRKAAIETYGGILALENASPFYRFLRGVVRLDEGDRNGALEDFTALKDVTLDWPAGVLDEWIAEASE